MKREVGENKQRVKFMKRLNDEVEEGDEGCCKGGGIRVRIGRE